MSNGFRIFEWITGLCRSWIVLSAAADMMITHRGKESFSSSVAMT